MYFIGVRDERGGRQSTVYRMLYEAKYKIILQVS